MVGVAMVLYLVQRASVASGHSIGSFLRRTTRETGRVFAFALLFGGLVYGLESVGRGTGLVGDIASSIFAFGLFGLTGVFILFLARQFAAPPWWRLNAWGSNLYDHSYTGSFRDIFRWILRDVAAMVGSLRPLDRLIVLAGMPALAWDFTQIAGTSRVLLVVLSVLLVAYLALGVALVTANRIPRTLMTRLQELREVSRRIASGDLAARAGQAELGDYEELAELVRDLNSMARALQARESENGMLQGRLRATLYHEQERATRDGLTGLRNNRYFHDSLAAELQRCSRTGELVTIGVIDLDNFKMVNDTYGHQEGDAVLQRVSFALTQMLRPYDLPCRLGGEEFGVIFPSTSPQEAKVVLDRLAAALTTAGPETAAQTFSGGIATFPHDSREQHDLYQKADAAAYSAKTKGKARTVIYDAAKVADMAPDERMDTRKRDALITTARSLVESVDARESAGQNHSELVGRYAAALAMALGLDEDFAHNMYLCGLLHDVGKIGIDDAIMGKAGALSVAEFDEMKRHPELGYKIVLNAGFGEIASWVRHHHEHWDGTGYPQALSGQNIPLGSRIVLVAEAYEAMTSERRYQSSRTPQQVLEELVRTAGTRFDPYVVEAMVYLVQSDLLVTGEGARIPLEQIPAARPDLGPPTLVPYVPGVLESGPPPAPAPVTGVGPSALPGVAPPEAHMPPWQKHPGSGPAADERAA